jgi:hypothetical protein
MQILNFFPSQHLLRLASVSRRFRVLATHIVYGRLILTASLKDRKLILECYHPTDQYTEPYLFCESLDIPGSADNLNSRGLRGEAKGKDSSFGTVTALYSRFKPVQADADPKPAYPHPTGSISDDQGTNDILLAQSTGPSDGVDKSIRRAVILDTYELFSQLCISVALVEVSPRRGVFLNCIDILKKRTARIWRQWLMERSYDSADGESEHVIWADQCRNVGLKVRIREMKGKNDVPVLQLLEENPAVSYTLELKGVYLMFYCDSGRGQAPSITRRNKEHLEFFYKSQNLSCSPWIFDVMLTFFRVDCSKHTYSLRDRTVNA